MLDMGINEDPSIAVVDDKKREEGQDFISVYVELLLKFASVNGKTNTSYETLLVVQR